MREIFFAFLILVSCAKTNRSQVQQQDGGSGCNIVDAKDVPKGTGWHLESASKRIYALADRTGNKDGRATTSEIEQLSREVGSQPPDAYSCFRKALMDSANQTVKGMSSEVEYLPPALRNVQEPLRELLVRVDLEWGNGDLEITESEIARARNFYGKLSDIFPREAELLKAFSEKRNASSLPPPPVGLRSTAANLLSEAMSRTARVAPWLNAQSEYHAPQWHQFSILDHSAETKVKMEYLVKRFNLQWSDGPVLMALHDIGKIVDRKWYGVPGDSSAGASFDSHATLGEAALKQAGWNDGAFLVANHEAIRKKTVAEILNITSDVATRQRLFLVFMSDNLGKGKTDSLKRELDTVLGPKLLELASAMSLDTTTVRAALNENGVTPQ